MLVRIPHPDGGSSLVLPPMSGSASRQSRTPARTAMQRVPGVLAASRGRAGWCQLLRRKEFRKTVLRRRRVERPGAVSSRSDAVASGSGTPSGGRPHEAGGRCCYNNIMLLSVLAGMRMPRLRVRPRFRLRVRPRLWFRDRVQVRGWGRVRIWARVKVRGKKRKEECRWRQRERHTVTATGRGRGKQTARDVQVGNVGTHVSRMGIICPWVV